MITKYMYTAGNIGRMMEFLIDNIFNRFGGCLFRQVVELINRIIFSNQQVLHRNNTYPFHVKIETF